MNNQNMIVVFTAIGLVLGGIIGVVANSEQASVAMLAAFGGVAGFLFGWLRKSRSDKSED